MFSFVVGVSVVYMTHFGSLRVARISCQKLFSLQDYQLRNLAVVHHTASTGFQITLKTKPGELKVRVLTFSVSSGNTAVDHSYKPLMFIAHIYCSFQPVLSYSHKHNPFRCIRYHHKIIISCKSCQSCICGK